jgi:hypothetical protein
MTARCVLAAAALAVAWSAAAAQPGVETLDACPFAQPDDPAPPRPVCGHVVTPENPDVPEGRQVRLGFMRLPSRAAEPSAPLFMLAGGPGQSLIKAETLILLADGFLGPMRSDHSEDRAMRLRTQSALASRVPGFHRPALSARNVSQNALSDRARRRRFHGSRGPGPRLRTRQRVGGA